MISETHVVTAKFLGLVDSGSACFEVKISDFKPASTVTAGVWFRSRAGEDFAIGQNYQVKAVVSQESKFSPRRYEVVQVY